MTDETLQEQEPPASLPPVEAEPEKSAPKYRKSVLREYFESIAQMAVVVTFGVTFVARPVNVPTASMENTIQVIDLLLVNKFIYGQEEGRFGPSSVNLSLDGITPHRKLKRGDVVVFKYPPNPVENYVKRVIGLPGETIEIRGRQVFINGTELPENRSFVEPDPNDKGKLAEIAKQDTPGASYRVYYRPHSGSDFGLGLRHGVGKPFKIPEGEYFMMGDNRDDSLDSRYWGTLRADLVVGRPVVVFASVNPSELNGQDTKITIPDLITRSRWGRIGTLIK